MKKDCRTCLPERKSRQFDFTLAGTRGRDYQEEKAVSMFDWKQLFNFQYSIFALLTLSIHLRHKLFIINNKTFMRTLTDNTLAVRSTNLKG